MDRLENILCEYTDIDVEWLLAGRGSMLRDERPASAIEPTVIYKSDPKDLAAIKDKMKIIDLQEARIRDLEAQLHTGGAVLDNAPAVDIPSVGGCQTSADQPQR